LTKGRRPLIEAYNYIGGRMHNACCSRDQGGCSLHGEKLDVETGTATAYNIPV